jgi:ribonuclease VapC
VIVLETSALIAVLRGESDRPRILDALNKAEHILMSAFSRYEALVVLRGKGESDPEDGVAQFLGLLEVEIIPFDEAQSTLAFQAYALFGKGSGSRARLNLADCAAYVLAKQFDAPLLFVGHDFTHTDVRAC